MSASFMYRRRPFSLTDRWPQSDSDDQVRLQHPLLPSAITCPSLEIAQLQMERLNTLHAAGYRARQSHEPEARIWEAAEAWDANGDSILDRVYYFVHQGDPVLINHTFEAAHIRRSLKDLCFQMRKRWAVPFAFAVDPQFNFYWPGVGTAFEIRGSGFAENDQEAR